MYDGTVSDDFKILLVIYFLFLDKTQEKNMKAKNN